MTKTDVNNLIKNMTKAGIVTKASPWAMEAIADQEYHVRYVGLNMLDDWAEIFALSNNLLIKFSVNRKQAQAELFLANQTPFIKIKNLKLDPGSKWELMLGQVKQQLKKDKAEFLAHQDKLGNLFVKIKDALKT